MQKRFSSRSQVSADPGQGPDRFAIIVSGPWEDEDMTVTKVQVRQRLHGAIAAVLSRPLCELIDRNDAVPPPLRIPASRDE